MIAPARVPGVVVIGPKKNGSLWPGIHRGLISELEIHAQSQDQEAHSPEPLGLRLGEGRVAEQLSCWYQARGLIPGKEQVSSP